MIFEPGCCGFLAIQKTEWIDQYPSGHEPCEIRNLQLAILRPRRCEHHRVGPLGAGQRLRTANGIGDDPSRNHRIVHPEIHAAQPPEKGERG